jgi:hypothetical protein
MSDKKKGYIYAIIYGGRWGANAFVAFCAGSACRASCHLTYGTSYSNKRDLLGQNAWVDWCELDTRNGNNHKHASWGVYISGGEVSIG